MKHCKKIITLAITAVMLLSTGFNISARETPSEDYLIDNGFVQVNSRSNTLNSPKVYKNINGDTIIRASDFEEEMYLNINRVEQAGHNVCWAACAEMVSKYKTNTTYDQFDAIRYIKNSIKYETATLSETVRVIDYMCQTRFHAYVYPFLLTKADIYDEISNFRPIVITACDKYNDNCHMFICAGYRMTDRYNTNTISEVYVIDPDPKDPNPHWIKYSDLTNTANGFKIYSGSANLVYKSNILIQ